MLFQTFEQELSLLKEKNQFRQIPPINHDGRYIWINNQYMLNLSGNDYLGLSYKEELQKEFLRNYSRKLPLFSSTSSRLLTGNSFEYRQLEHDMAKAFNKESCLLFNSGYHANIGILPAIANKHTLILSDRLIHASMIDGIRLSGSTCLRYEHNDYEQLSALLDEHASKYSRIIIVTESLFSMDGDFADLHKLVQLKQRYPHVLLYVDEAHAIGVYGENGLGLAEQQHCIDQIDILVGTFGKAMASMGAYVISSQTIRDILINKMRPLLFSTALPPLNLAWTHFIFKQLPVLKEQRTHLAKLGSYLRERLVQDFQVDMPSQSHIVPFIIGANAKTKFYANSLQEGGYYCLPIRPPTVPQGTSRIRFSLNADFQYEEIDRLLEQLRSIHQCISKKGTSSKQELVVTA